MIGALTGNRQRVSARLGEVNALREAFGHFLTDMGVPPTKISDWQLILTEIFANAVRHGCQSDDKQHVSVSWEAWGKEISLSIVDPGSGPPPELTENPQLPMETSTSGRGLFLAASLADRIEHWRNDGEGYCCKVIMRHEDLNPAHSSEALMENAMMELSTTYESLAAFYRLGEALVESETVVDFLHQALQDLQDVAPHEECRIYLSDEIQPALLAELVLNDLALGAPGDSLRLEQVIDSEEEYSWNDYDQADPHLIGLQSGILCPVIAAGRVCGALMLGNYTKPMGLLAGVRHTIRTFADLIGIAVMNASNAQMRDRESQALRELEIASEMQDRLLPLPRKTRGDGWSAFVRRRTARDVSGDHVEICETRSGDIIFCTIDVMGKGVPAAFLAAMFRTALHISVTFQYSLVGLMMALNRTLCRELEEMTMFATCAIARVPANLRKVEIVNAGHCPVMGCMEGGGLFAVEPSGPPLGLFTDAEYTAERFSLDGGARVLMVTDGLFEWSRDGDIWGWQNLVDFLIARKSQSAESIWKELREEIDSAHEPVNDDQTFLCWEKL